MDLRSYMRSLSTVTLTRATVAVFVAVAFWLRAHRLAAQCLWSDEDITLDRAGLALRELVSTLPVEHGPLYFVLMRGWTLLAGSDDLALRFPSLFFGVLAVPLAAYVGRRLVDRATGVILAIVFAINPFLVWYGQEARMYTLVGALSLLSISLVLRAERTRRRGWWALAGLAAALAMYTHYYAGLLVFILGSWALLDVAHRDRRNALGWITAALTGALVFSPWLPRAAQVLGFPGWREAVDLAEVPGILIRAWTAGATAPPDLVASIALLYMLLGGIGLLMLAIGSRPMAGDRQGARPSQVLGARRAIVYAIVPSLAVALLMLRIADFHPRYFFAVLPAYYTLVAVGAARAPLAFRIPAVLALVACAAVPLHNLYSSEEYQKQDYRGFIRTVEQAAGHEDTVLFLDGPSYGLTRRYEVADSPVKIVNLQSSSNRERTQDVLDAAMAELAGEYPHLWLAANGAECGAGCTWLGNSAFPVDSEAYGDVRLDRYFSNAFATLPDLSTRAIVCPDGDAQAACLTIGLQLAAPTSVRAGSVLPLLVRWLPRSDIDIRPAISLRLADPVTGAKVAQVDRRAAATARAPDAWHQGAALEARHGLWVPEGLAPADYRIVVVFYDSATAEPLASWSGWTITVTADE